MNTFEAGRLNSPLPESYANIQPQPVTEAVAILYPSRMEAMALDPSKLEIRDDMKYSAGQVDVCVNATRTIQVAATESDSIEVSAREKSKTALMRHAGLLMKKVLNYDGGFEISLSDDTIPRHCGFGSSSSTIAGICVAINELFGKPIKPLDLARFSAQNHGEEIDGHDNNLTPVQCIGGSAICGMFEGSLIVVTGESTPIYRGRLPDKSQIVMGVPKSFSHPDANELMDNELDNMDGFVNTGIQHGNEVAYRMLHEALPGLTGGDYKPLKQLVFDYRWRMGSIANCSFVFPPIIEIAQELAHHETDQTTSMIALSSVGPGFFAVTTNALQVEKEFESLDMEATVFQPWEDTYKVLSKGSVR